MDVVRGTASLLSGLQNKIDPLKVPRRCKTSWALLHVNSNEISGGLVNFAEPELQLGTSEHHYTWSNTKSQHVSILLRRATGRSHCDEVTRHSHSHAMPLNKPP